MEMTDARGRREWDKPGSTLSNSYLWRGCSLTYFLTVETAPISARVKSHTTPLITLNNRMSNKYPYYWTAQFSELHSHALQICTRTALWKILGNGARILVVIRHSNISLIMHAFAFMARKSDLLHWKKRTDTSTACTLALPCNPYVYGVHEEKPVGREMHF